MRSGARYPRDLWSHIEHQEASIVDAANGVGPYVETGNVIRRHLRCANYDACLSVAASRRWPSFHCDGCRRTRNGSFLDQPRTTGG